MDVRLNVCLRVCFRRKGGGIGLESLFFYFAGLAVGNHPTKLHNRMFFIGWSIDNCRGMFRCSAILEELLPLIFEAMDIDPRVLPLFRADTEMRRVKFKEDSAYFFFLDVDSFSLSFLIVLRIALIPSRLIFLLELFFLSFFFLSFFFLLRLVPSSRASSSSSNDLFSSEPSSDDSLEDSVPSKSDPRNEI